MEVRGTVWSFLYHLGLAADRADSIRSQGRLKKGSYLTNNVLIVFVVTFKAFA